MNCGDRVYVCVYYGTGTHKQLFVDLQVAYDSVEHRYCTIGDLAGNHIICNRQCNRHSFLRLSLAEVSGKGTRACVLPCFFDLQMSTPPTGSVRACITALALR